MNKKLSMTIGFLVMCLLLFSAGCINIGQQNNQAEQTKISEGPPPDYTSIDTALKDPSPLVRIQAVEALKNLKHTTAINKLIMAVYDNIDNEEVTTAITKALVSYGKAAIQPVKTSIWLDKSFAIQKAAFVVLSGVDDTPAFYKEAWVKFLNTPYSEESGSFRIEMVKFLISQYKKGYEEYLPSIVSLLKDPDKALQKVAIRKMSLLNEKQAIKYLETLYIENRNNYPVVLNILVVMNSYPPYSDKNPIVNVDISIFLNTFGSYDKQIQEQSYLGLKNFGFNDKNGRVLRFLSHFENCEVDLIRSNAFELAQLLQNRKLSAKAAEPQFVEPVVVKREGFCAS